MKTCQKTVLLVAPAEIFSKCWIWDFLKPRKFFGSFTQLFFHKAGLIFEPHLPNFVNLCNFKIYSNVFLISTGFSFSKISVGLFRQYLLLSLHRHTKQIEPQPNSLQYPLINLLRLRQQQQKCDLKVNDWRRWHFMLMGKKEVGMSYEIGAREGVGLEKSGFETWLIWWGQIASHFLDYLISRA